MSESSTPAAGWYPDPAWPGNIRYWDGTAWTTHQAAPQQWQAPNVAPPEPPDPAMKWLFPVGRSWWAIAAGYAGLFGFLILPAPLALVLGIIALVDIGRHPEKGGRGRAIFAIVVGALGSILLVAALTSG